MVSFFSFSCCDGQALDFLNKCLRNVLIVSVHKWFPNQRSVSYAFWCGQWSSVFSLCQFSNFIVGSSHTIDSEILLNQMCGLNPRRYFDLIFSHEKSWWWFYTMLSRSSVADFYFWEKKRCGRWKQQTWLLALFIVLQLVKLILTRLNSSCFHNTVFKQNWLC